MTATEQLNFTAFWENRLYDYEIGEWVMYRSGNGEDDGVVEDRKLNSIGQPMYLVNGRYRYLNKTTL